MLLTGCGAPEAGTEPGASQEEKAGKSETAPVELNTSVPAAYKASAEAGNGWQLEFKSSGGGDTASSLVGDYLMDVSRDSDAIYAITGINANTGEEAINVEVPKLEEPFANSEDSDVGYVRHRDKDYLYVVQGGVLEKGDGLSASPSGFQVSFLELAEGSDLITLNVPMGPEAHQDSLFLSFTDADQKVVKVPTPDGVKEFKEGAYYMSSPVADPEGESVGGIAPNGDPVRIRSFPVADESKVIGPGEYSDETYNELPYVKVGNWDVTKAALGGRLAEAYSVSLLRQDGNNLYFSWSDGYENETYHADLSTKKTSLIAKGEGVGGLGNFNGSPDRRYSILGNLIHDTKTGKVHDLREKGDRLEVRPATIGNDGVVYGMNNEKVVVSYDTGTEKFTAEGELEYEPVGMTTSETLILDASTGQGAPAQGVRKQ